MKLSHRTKRNIYQIIPFGIMSFSFSAIYAILEKGILGDHPVYPSTGNPYLFNLLVPSIAAGIFGLFIGVLEMRFLSRWFRKGSFFRKIIFKSSIYMFLIIMFTMLVASIGTAYELGTSPLNQKVLAYNYTFFSSVAFWTILLYITLGIVICLFYVEVSNNVGQTVLLNLFAGKYHHPVEEDRIFMFVDMKSSTQIAEQLGHVKYFELLREYYYTMSDAIIDYGGQIYQYVGDEVVITWRLKNNREAQCIQCFFAMKDAIERKKERFMADYGVVPTFKAGVHLGEVTTGEIGKIKKDIVFTGDVLNTTARIQGLCNTYHSELLLSGQLVEALRFEGSFSTIELGETELRGRNEKVKLFTVERTNRS